MPQGTCNFCAKVYHPTTTAVHREPLIALRDRYGFENTGINSRGGLSLIAQQLHEETFGGIFSDWVIGHLAFPVGGREFPPMVTASEGLPQLVPEPTGLPEVQVHETVDRRDRPQAEAQLPVTLTAQQLDDALWLVQMGLLARVEDYVPPVTASTPVPLPADIQEAAQVPIVPGTGVALFPSEEDDVGWITDVYTIYDAVVEGGALPGGAPLQPTTFGGPIATVPAPIPAGAPVPTATTGDRKKYCYKFIDGQWKLVKSRSRRRKKLVTKSDIAGLAQLKGVVGMGKTMEMWIATHS